MLKAKRFWIILTIPALLTHLQKTARQSVLGAYIKDFTGAVLEFFGKAIEEKDVEWEVKFEGGGALHASPRQITDDSEMSLSMMRSILAWKKED